MVVVDHHEYLCEEEKRLKDDRERKAPMGNGPGRLL
jgi:hypothetical protein